jgi:BASS family bile acid:Na+ symporter
MDQLAHLVPLVLKLSILAMVFALGLHTKPRDVLYLLSRPVLLLKSLLSLDVIVPSAAILMALWLPIPDPVKMALVALSLSPIPPLLPNKVSRVGGDKSYGFGLMVIAAALAVIFVPWAVSTLGGQIGRDAAISITTVAKIMAVNVLAPILAGLLVSQFLPDLARRIAKPIGQVATILLALCLPLVLLSAWPAMKTLIGDGTLLAIAAFIITGLVAGHALGGPDPADRRALAVASASRHPGVALAIASANAAQPKLVTAAVMLYLLLGVPAVIAYHAFMKRREGDPGKTSIAAT